MERVSLQIRPGNTVTENIYLKEIVDESESDFDATLYSCVYKPKVPLHIA